MYRIPESVLHCYLTNTRHHTDHMTMFQARVPPSVLIQRNSDQLSGMVIVQVDDIMGLGTKTFLHQEEESTHRYNSKPGKKLTTIPTFFNGSHIRH